MRFAVRWAVIGALIGGVLAPPLLAESGTKTKSAPARDPNEVVCEKQEVTGSRLATKKVCMTRSQWAQKRRDDRDAIDKTQINSCLKQGGC